MAKLIAGLHQPSSGEILFDGNHDSLAASARITLAMVQQEIQLFGCSVRDNLSLWNSTIRERDLNQACRDAEILGMWCAHSPMVSRQNSVKEDKTFWGPTPTVGIGTSASGKPQHPSDG